MNGWGMLQGNRRLCGAGIATAGRAHVQHAEEGLWRPGPLCGLWRRSSGESCGGVLLNRPLLPCLPGVLL